uniref:Small ribosomal subunit protein uS15c n=1 Tax=Fargesia denudata TaxID=1306438 RepID=A0A1W6GX75_9POAL|nr:ribosomal protein S15 [Fargesia denudata]ARM20411.1 ribosomal protein S15 [Fargesia denudata]
MVKEEKEENRGSVEFQVFSFTNKIRRLASHLELHKKDFSSERGLRRLLGKRQRLLAYLAKKNRVRYKIGRASCFSYFISSLIVVLDFSF